MRAQRSKLDLAAQMALTEANYARLMKLMPDMDERERADFTLALPSGKDMQLSLKVIERCRYTTILEFKQVAESFSEQLNWAPAPRFLLRAYHDARMAEVSAFQDNHRLRSEYEYPNKQMFQRDEKSQLNQLLSDWLTMSLRYGLHKKPLFTS